MSNLFQVYAGQHRQFLTKLEADEIPILKHRAQFILALPQGLSQCGYAQA